MLKQWLSGQGVLVRPSAEVREQDDSND
jgi:hypothetical protein